MEYRLLREDAQGPMVASSDSLDSELAAMTWARNWLGNHTDHNCYRLEPSHCLRPMLMVRTVAGQWYAIPVAAEVSDISQGA